VAIPESRGDQVWVHESVPKSDGGEDRETSHRALAVRRTTTPSRITSVGMGALSTDTWLPCRSSCSSLAAKAVRRGAG